MSSTTKLTTPSHDPSSLVLSQETSPLTQQLSPSQEQPQSQQSQSYSQVQQQQQQQQPPYRRRPSQVQTTNLPYTYIPTASPSAITTSSSMASSPIQASPTMSSESAVPTTISSMQASPTPSRGRDSDVCSSLPPIDMLPEALVNNSSQDQCPSTDRPAQPDPPPKSGGLFRRFSTRVKTEGSRLMGSRRTSSTHPVSRDTSVGPAVMRRGRSDSSVTAPPDYAVAVGSDSDDDFVSSKEQPAYPMPITEGEALRDFSPTCGGSSVAATSMISSDNHTGPVVQQILLQGTPITKVSTKRRKQLTLVLDQDAGKIFWDRNRPSKCVYIDDIKEIRIAPDVRQNRLDCGVAEGEEPRFFSILYAVRDKKPKTMHLIANSAEHFEHWVTTLEALSKHRHEHVTSLMAFNDRAIKEYWRKEMARLYPENPPIEEELDFAGVEQVCRNLHIHVSSEMLKAKFDRADRFETGKLNFAAFQDFVRLMAHRADVDNVYGELSLGNEDGLDFQDFIRFLRDVQREDVTDLAAKEAIFNQLSRKPVKASVDDSNADMPRMSQASLAKYLMSNHNLPVEAIPQHCDLNRPVNEYFISSSHNTYLTGRQVVDISSIEGYISALMRGCRCVEVDCWDGPDNEPMVTHGKTLTSNIMFREVIAAINKYAFAQSQYPLWVSLEVHCNPVQQEIMASIMKEIFGDKLVTQQLEGVEGKLPSPEQLKGRILVKCKSPNLESAKNAETSTMGRRRGNSLTSPFSRPAAPSDASIPNSPLLSPNYSGSRFGSTRRVNTINEGEIPDAQDALSTSSSEDSGPEKVPKSKQSKITRVLGDLGVYCLGVKFRGFDDADCKIFNHILSFKERTFLNNSSTKASKDALFRHNMRYLMRVYPGQHRVTSTNFDPLIYWRRGVQMAALNWQTFDLGMQFNQAMFAGGKDGSGYVLKPRAFREIQILPDGLTRKRERTNVSFTIDIISAQQLMRPTNLGERRTVDPYIEIEVFLADDKRDKQDVNGQPLRRPLKYRTQVIRENGFNPIFQKQCKFDVRTKYPDLIFVRWSVKLSDGGSYNDRSPAVATYTAKLTSLKQGYRTLPLLDHNGDKYLFSTLFCRINVQPITSVFVDYQAETDNTNKLKGLRAPFFGRKDQSPKASMDKDPAFASISQSSM
ncbi:PLC-like phosphodiesterase [Coniella lustricola]|uniref:Phosphoinositide phospholipase C n=1 Tax=Coniella lustricola TaxID=2025994 RepID=A0A2T3A286_9PEZI|nr:PLC-like phosphodiesterase [Coniella lustricola]